MQPYLKGLIILFLCAWCQVGYGQDSLEQVYPGRALLWSIIPGCGQIYNQEMWKFPVTISAGIAIGYYIVYQNNIYNILRASLRNERDNNPDTINRLNRFSEASLRNGVEVFRRNRDLLIIIASVMYVLQGLEAYVSAHLKNFDAAFDQQPLSVGMRIEPVFGNQMAYVCQLRWNL